MKLHTKITSLNRVGKALEKRFKRLQIETVRDLLFYFPFRYEDYSAVVDIENLEEGMDVTVRGKIELISNKRSPRKRKMITEAVVADETDQIRIVWFGQPFIKNILHVGDEVFFSGKIKEDMFGVQMVGPAYEKASSKTTHTARIVPMYPLTSGVTQKQMRFLMSQVIGLTAEIEEWLPEEILERGDLMPLAEAMKGIHFPESQDELKHAERRMKFDELYILQLRGEMIRQSVQASKASRLEFKQKEIKEFVDSLPFTLTKAQKVSSWEILQDLEKEHPMNRLLEGDVGSGKTVVAAMGLYSAVLNNKQAVLMAPTEILAFQHFESLVELLSDCGVTVGLLTRTKKIEIGDKEIKRYKEDKEKNKNLSLISYLLSQNKSSNKKELLKSIKNGDCDIIIGTHAILSEKVEFKDLGFVIIDEQHRFGVEQRAVLGRRLTRTGADLRGRIDINSDEDTESNFLYGNLTYSIRKCLFSVRKNVSLGHKEKIYQNAVEEEFKKNGLLFEREKVIDVKYDGKKIGVYRPDFVIDNKVILELKALPFVGQKEKTQIWTYLKGSSYKLALLANFSPKDIEIERIVYDTARQPDINNKNKESALSQCQSATCPHFLSMTATPIPRSFALTLYGDLDLSIVNEMPPGRKPVKTRAVDPHNREKAYDFIREQVKNGRQVFVICPLIDEKNVGTGRDLSLPAGAEKKSVLSEYEKLSKQIFPDLKIGYLHGKLKSEEKDETMKEFSDGKIDILVSTSVIEVGVNIPNASVMMIEGADRFGLAQLHQFRGRVGRSEHQSYCFLFTDSDSDKVGERLKFFESTTDGFKVAEYDLEMRGPGEVYGTTQSGMMNMRFAKTGDKELIKLARELARGIDFDKFPELREHVKAWEEKVHLE